MEVQPGNLKYILDKSQIKLVKQWWLMIEDWNDAVNRLRFLLENHEACANNLRNQMKINMYFIIYNLATPHNCLITITKQNKTKWNMIIFSAHHYYYSNYDYYYNYYKYYTIHRYKKNRGDLVLTIIILVINYR